MSARTSSVKFPRRLSLDAGRTWQVIAILAYDRGMSDSVNLQTVHRRKLAAVRREVAPGAVGSAWRPALDKVWEFIRSNPGLRTDGHNIFLYHHPTKPVRRYSATSVSRSRAHLNLRARCTRLAMDRRDKLRARVVGHSPGLMR